MQINDPGSQNDHAVPSGCNLPRGIRYEVLVGHSRVHVEGASVGDAIGQARQRLCREMPRLWDVIQALQIDQFRVRPLS